ncbi:hypothetical protein D9615_009702 [Tricholomella constricta]|uniref:Uncharacterized protein n=1 Tax=Tricholomella constricta TaxID=117010 RepID=A0A8H5GUX1_9AGAR|nr:hypothetical protein D9615_009702 [Tricholomella constricta]
MTTLRVTFPNDWPGWSIQQYILQSVQEPCLTDAIPITARVHSETYSDFYSDSPVFRASLIGPLIGPPKQAAIVALKFAFREDLIADLTEEAEVYKGALESLQGTAVPRCYGLYNGYGVDGEPIACLMLEYWGECIHQPFEHLPLNVRIRILQRLGDIHKQGLVHGDFAERNVLELDGDVRIIDFDQTENHRCDCDMDFRPGEMSPDMQEFGCAQLWKVCRSDMKIWSDRERHV